MREWLTILTERSVTLIEILALAIWLRRTDMHVTAVALGAIAGGTVGDVIGRLRIAQPATAYPGSTGTWVSGAQGWDGGCARNQEDTTGLALVRRLKSSGRRYQRVAKQADSSVRNSDGG